MEASQSPVLLDDAVPEPPIRRQEPVVPNAANELRGLQYFREQTSQILGGHYDNDFWTHAIMRLSYTHEALQHFIIAIASLEEAFCMRALSDKPSQDSRKQYTLGLQQYSKAIQRVLKLQYDPRGISVIIASTVLTFLIELWLGDMLAAQRHAISAKRLLLSGDFRIGEEAHDFLVGYFQPMVLRMCAQFSLGHMSDMCADEPDVSAAINVAPQANLDLDLNDIVAAKSEFDKLSSDLVVRAKAHAKSFCQDTTSLERRLEVLLITLDKWYNRVAWLDQRSRVAQPFWSRDRRLLEIRYRYFRIALMTLPLEDEMAFDSHVEDFRIMVEMSDLVVQETSQIRPGVWRSNEAITTMALLFAGCSCRIASIRRKAIRLLYRHRRLEGVWSSIACGIYAEHILMEEEIGLGDVQTCSDVPPKCRVRPVSLHYDSGNSSPRQRPQFTLTYTRPEIDAKKLLHQYITFDSYSIMSEYGLEPIIWFPNQPKAPILEEEIKMSAKGHDGPHMLPIDWTVFHNHELDGALRMTLLKLSF